VIQRFLGADLKSILLRFYQEEAPFMMGDPTETSRLKTWKTEDVGTLSNEQTSGS
jgi:hypothetical protein